MSAGISPIFWNSLRRSFLLPGIRAGDLDLPMIQDLIFSGGECRHGEGADTNSFQSLDFVSEFGEHAADLAVVSLRQNDVEISP